MSRAHGLAYRRDRTENQAALSVQASRAPEDSGGAAHGQPAAAGLTEVTSGANKRVDGFWGRNRKPSGQAEHRDGCNLFCRSKRRPGGAFVELDAGLGRVVDEVPVRHWLGSILTGGRSTGGGDLRRFTAVGKSPLDGSDFGDEGGALLGVRDRPESGHCRCDGQCRFWVVSFLPSLVDSLWGSSEKPCSNSHGWKSAVVSASVGKATRPTFHASSRHRQQRRAEVVEAVSKHRSWPIATLRTLRVWPRPSGVGRFQSLRTPLGRCSIPGWIAGREMGEF